MMESHFLKGANEIDGEELVVTITQAYDFVKLGINKGVPHVLSFELSLADEDVDTICELLQQAKKLRPKE